MLASHIILVAEALGRPSSGSSGRPAALRNWSVLSLCKSGSFSSSISASSWPPAWPELSMIYDVDFFGIGSSNIVTHQEFWVMSHGSGCQVYKKGPSFREHVSNSDISRSSESLSALEDWAATSASQTSSVVPVRLPQCCPHPARSIAPGDSWKQNSFS